MHFKSSDVSGGGKKKMLFPRSQFYVSESNIDGDVVWKWPTQVHLPLAKTAPHVISVNTSSRKEIENKP